ncbi:hypothetical protein FOZ63_001610, partial [Perkinsus olseni]
MFELIVGVAVGAGLGAYFPDRVRPCFEPLVTETRKIGIRLRDKIRSLKEDPSAPKDHLGPSNNGRPSLVSPLPILDIVVATNLYSFLIHVLITSPWVVNGQISRPSSAASSRPGSTSTLPSGKGEDRGRSSEVSAKLAAIQSNIEEARGPRGRPDGISSK